MKVLKEAALWVAVFGSVAGVSWSLHEWEAAGRGAMPPLHGLGQQDSACATGGDAPGAKTLQALCGAARAPGDPAVIRPGQIGID
jgi:hypothetical protein